MPEEGAAWGLAIAQISCINSSIFMSFRKIRLHEKNLTNRPRNQAVTGCFISIFGYDSAVIHKQQEL
jgi:hypothetical protein